MNSDKAIENAYELAKERYAHLGIDTDKALNQLKSISLSLHCWQTDDVAGFEKPDATLSGGGIQATGNYPGKATNLQQVRSDMERVYSLIPGSHRFNMHASYGDFGDTFVDRNEIQPEHFTSWVEWANSLGIKLDFNSTCYSHPLADDGFTLSSIRRETREFWIEHVSRAREISAYLGREDPGWFQRPYREQVETPRTAQRCTG